MNTKNAQTVANSTVEHSVKGKKGSATLLVKENGDRIALIKLASGKNLTVAADRINLRAMQAESVADALNKTCYGTGRISLYNVESFHGPKGVTRIYSSVTNGQETGYGLFLKQGKKALSFALNRLNLGAMKADNVNDAARKAAFTGRIALVNA